MDSTHYAVNLISGAIAGVNEHWLMLPLDTIKTRIQASTSSKKFSTMNIFSNIIKEEGIYSLWRGATPVVVGAAPSHAVYFAVYEASRSLVATQFGGDAQSINFLRDAIPGVIATVISDFTMNPFDIVKQRLQLGSLHYSSMTHCFRSIIQTEGITSLWRSYPTTLIMNIPFFAVWSSVFENSRLWLNPFLGNDQDKFPFLENLLAGGLAGGAASLLTNPFDVTKTRLQVQNLGCHDHGHFTPHEYGGPKYKGFFQAVQQVYKTEGLSAFGRGSTARVLYNVPAAAICWTTFEFVKYLLGGTPTPTEKVKPCC